MVDRHEWGWRLPARRWLVPCAAIVPCGVIGPCAAIGLCAVIGLLGSTRFGFGAPPADVKPAPGDFQSDPSGPSDPSGQSDASGQQSNPSGPRDPSRPRDLSRPGDTSGASGKGAKRKPIGPLGKERPKPEFNRLLFRLKTSDRREGLHAIKPGHWTAVTVETCANHFDFQGDLTLEACQQDRRPLEIEGAPFYLTIDRGAILPKAQKKIFEAPFFTPRAINTASTHPWVDCRLSDAGTGANVKQELDELQPMASYQFQFLVLARLPERYAYLQTLPSVRPPDEVGGRPDPYLYRIIAPPIGVRAPLPASSLLWTSLAYIVWDEVHPDILDEEQRQALFDWLHWGGHLIISGPRSLELLENSFLASHLPAAAAESILLAPDRLADLDAHWSSAQTAIDRAALAGGGPWPASRLKLLPGGLFLPHADELVAERPVGRGRIVATAFSLSQPAIAKWRGFDGLFNSCLLRREPRRFTAPTSLAPAVTWLAGANKRIAYEFGPNLTHLRFFARDAGAEPRAEERDNDEPISPMSLTGGANYAGGEIETEELGVASWNDFASVPTTARQSLRQGAGIKVLSPSFVLWTVGLYLIVLVPVNWALFRLLGRVEWAWVAAPLIAFGCAALVIWLAQLDIGFSRSSTELAILEIEGGYPRAHLTRYTALYASLSTSYNLAYDDPSAVALPFGRADYETLSGQSHRPVRFRGQGRPQLSGLDVTSNSTSMVHSESFYNLGGSLAWTAPDKLVNASPLSLSGVSLVRRLAGAAMEVAWIGDLPAGGAVIPAFQLSDAAAETADPWKGDRVQQSPATDNGLNLRALVALAEARQNVEPGELRMVGWHLDDLPGVSIEPQTVRRRHATLVVAHLARANDIDIWPDQWDLGAEHLLDAPLPFEPESPNIPDPNPADPNPADPNPTSPNPADQDPFQP